MKVIELIKKLYLKIKSHLQWHIFPSKDELSLKSFLEVFYYVFVTFCLIIVFYWWNKVPERNIVMFVDPIHPSIVYGDSVMSVDADVELTIPSTTKESSINGMCIQLSFSEERISKEHKDSIPQYSYFFNPQNKLAKQLVTELNTKNVYKSLDSACMNYPEMRDKKWVYFARSYNRGLNAFPFPLKSIGFEAIEPDSIKNDTVYNYYEYIRNKEYNLHKIVLGHKDWNFQYNLSSSGDVLGRPKWYRLEDVSQAYYDVRLLTNYIDSMSLKIDFVGFAEFSNMTPEPDERGMGFIKFTDHKKMMDISKNGIQFHVHFKELENLQTIRMLGVTAVLSGLIIIFVALIFVMIYNFGRWFKEHILWGIISLIVITIIVLYFMNVFEIIVYAFTT